MRGTTVSRLLAMLKAQVRTSLTQGASDDWSYVQQLWDKQLWLATEYMWPFMERTWDVALVPGTRYYAFPTARSADKLVKINVDSPLTTFVKFNDKWIEVGYDISAPELNSNDSDLGQLLDPVQRWDYYDQTGFEVWPVPATAQTFRFIGQRLPYTWWDDIGSAPETGDMGEWLLDSTADMDDELIVLFTAAEILQGLQQSDAQVKLALAQARLRRVGATMPRRSDKVIFGDALEKEQMAKVVPMIVVAHN